MGVSPQLSLILLFLIPNCVISEYEPTWESLDSRPLPKWYDEAKIGIFVHWGVYSVPSYKSEWFWMNWIGRNGTKYVEFMKKNYPPGFRYQDFAQDFKAELFEPEEWAELFKKSGAKYVVLTSKHHEGFTLWPSSYSFSWNSVDVGPHRDLVGDLARAIRNSTDLRFGLYYSLLEWFNPLYVADRSAQFSQDVFVRSKMYPEIMELTETYEPEIIWTDGEWEPTSDYWKSKEFLAWLYNHSPVKDTVVVNDRWGMETLCKHGGFLTCADGFQPGELQDRKWENAMTIDSHSWGYRREAKLNEYYTSKELVGLLVETISFGGNILINVGPTKEGTISPIYQERLLDVGKWLHVNGDAIYSTKSWLHQEDVRNGTIFYTSKGHVVYAITLEWPEGNILSLKSAIDLFNGGKTVVTLLGHPTKLKWNVLDKVVKITFPDKAIIKSEWAWAVKIDSVKK